MKVRSKRINRAIFFSLSIIVVLALGWIVYRSIRGQSLGLGIFTRIGNIVRSVIGSSTVVADNHGDYKDVIFLHHSVGHNIIEQGNLRQHLEQFGFSLWDQDYISIGLTGPDGLPAGYSYDIPGDNTNPDGLVRIFQQPVFELPVNAFSALLQHEVIVFKSCFPNSDIQDDASLEFRKQEYLKIRQQIDQHPDRIFILLTTPPLNPAGTDMNAARRARELANWLVSAEYTGGHPNLYVFDLFDLLAEKDPASPEFNMLQKAFREGTDSHPNALANQRIAPLLAEYINLKTEEYKEQISSSSSRNPGDK